MQCPECDQEWNGYWCKPLKKLIFEGCDTCPLKWKCKEGHIWSAPLNRIKDHGKWCPYCAGNIRLTLKEACIIAKNRGDECLSTQNINNMTPLCWRCNKLHTWHASLGSHTWCTSFYVIRNHNTWCPYCKNKCENQSKFYLGLELDIYYSEFGLAIEIWGQQYKKYIEFFYRDDPNNFI
ncbi:hypothetical protein Glove_88g24 [Diversispora epigaea]|uniref:Zinc-ribbon domain-containing protein n=1 Tax=Diversispora epigaea TaxID=1348612 RepID=A0A397J5T3_9GLOM|nr:hypothetical protein Glove_88g24 [Diversispora epigaea]